MDRQALSVLLKECHRLAADYFRRRGSVPALSELCCTMHDALLARGLTLVTERLGCADLTYALLATGARGRREETLKRPSWYLLLSDHPNLRQVSHTVAVLLEEYDRNYPAQVIWQGSRAAWGAFLAAPLGAAPAGSPPAAPVESQHQLAAGFRRLPLLGDLTLVGGDRFLAGEAIEAARQAVARELSSSLSEPTDAGLAPDGTAVHPALGFLGNFRLEKKGEFRGQLDVDQGALIPLTDCVRLLALREGLSATGTMARIAALRDRGVLPGELARRLCDAYLTFMHQRVVSELESAGSGGFVSPAHLGEQEARRLRGGLEAVVALQKVVRRRAPGKG